MLLRLSETNFSAPALLVNCHFDRCRLHDDAHDVDEDEEDDVDDEEDVDDDGGDGNDDPQRRARSRCQRQHAQLCHHA